MERIEKNHNGKRWRHGASRTIEYGVYKGIISRERNHKGSVSDRWLESFENFYDDMGDKPVGTRFTRIDTSKQYGKDSCAWVNFPEVIAMRDEERRRRNSAAGYKDVDTPYELSGKQMTYDEIIKELDI